MIPIPLATSKRLRFGLRRSDQLTPNRRNGATMKKLIALLALSSAAASAGTLFCGAYPYWVLVIDEGQGKVVDKIRLETGLPTGAE